MGSVKHFLMGRVQQGFDFEVARKPFDAPYQSKSPTSRAAAEAIAPRAGTLRRAVLDFLVGLGDHGATDEEMQTALKMGANTQRPRRVELVAGGFVVDSDQTRPTMSGKAATVWIATEYKIESRE